jgi:rubredoxin
MMHEVNIVPSILSKEADKMENIKKKRVCAHCGYTADGRFEGDICPKCGLTYWKCKKCGFLITAVKPPEACPECGERCDFINVTCYLPDCGGPGNIDPRLLEKPHPLWGVTING